MDSPTGESSDPTAAGCARKKRRVILILYGLGVVFGVLDTLFADLASYGPASEVLGALSIILGISLWCHYDASQRDYTIGRALRLAILLILLVGFPVYAFRTRGWSGFGLIGWGILFFVSFVALYGAAGLVTAGACHLLQG